MDVQRAAYKYAWQDVTENFLERLKWENLTYQGKIDITNHIPFADLADYWGLTERQYNRIIERAQKEVDKKLDAWLQTLSENERISFRTGIPLAYLEK